MEWNETTEKRVGYVESVKIGRRDFMVGNEDERGRDG